MKFQVWTFIHHKDIYELWSVLVCDCHLWQHGITTVNSVCFIDTNPYWGRIIMDYMYILYVPSLLSQSLHYYYKHTSNRGCRCGNYILFTAHWSCDPLHVDPDQNCFITPDCREGRFHSTHGVGLLWLWPQCCYYRWSSRHCGSYEDCLPACDTQSGIWCAQLRLFLFMPCYI